MNFFPSTQHQMTEQRIVPAPFDMDRTLISGLPELQAHLQQVADDDSRLVDAKLLDTVELQLTESNSASLIPSILPILTQILKSTRQDPTPLLSLAIKLLASRSFTQALALADTPSLLAALRSPLPGANQLALAIMAKAAAAPPDVALLAAMPDLVTELVRCWLESPDVGSGQRAARLLGDLLETDCNLVAPASSGTSGASNTDLVKRRVPGHGRLWHLIIMDRSSLALIRSLCSPSPSGSGPSRPTHAVTLSQGRLLGLLPRLATLNIRAVAQSPFPDLFPLPHDAARLFDHGLLQWAALSMVDRSDELMRLTLVDFFETLVSLMGVSQRTQQTDQVVGNLVQAAIQHDAELKNALLTLPDRTVEEESEDLRRYIAGLVD